MELLPTYLPTSEMGIGRAGMTQTTAGSHYDVITRETCCTADKVSFSLASSPAVTSTEGDNSGDITSRGQHSDVSCSLSPLSSETHRETP